MKDRELDELLSKWQPKMPIEPGFQRSVWLGIETIVSGISVSERLQILAVRITAPAVGLPAAAAVIGLAAVLAIHDGTEFRDRAWFDLAARYEKSIAPDQHLYPDNR